MEFPKTWFRDDELNWTQVRAYQDVGTLSIDDERLRFVSDKRDVPIPLTTVRSVDRVRIGRDFVNKWVRVEYQDNGESRRVYFVDGGKLGWSGMLGGTARLFEAVRQSVESARHRT